MPWVLYHQIENLLQRGFSRGKLAGFVQKSVVKVDTIDVMIGERVVQCRTVPKVSSAQNCAKEPVTGECMTAARATMRMVRSAASSQHAGGEVCARAHARVNASERLRVNPKHHCADTQVLILSTRTHARTYALPMHACNRADEKQSSGNAYPWNKYITAPGQWFASKSVTVKVTPPFSPSRSSIGIE
jgi:hypothetical protein